MVYMEVIIEAIQRYYPDWEPPPNNREWNKALCPFHGETRPSAAVSYDLDGFNCFACDVRGDAISIIRNQEEVSYAEAKRIAEKISVGSDIPLQSKPARKRGRRVFGEQGDTGEHAVRPGIRSRASFWA